MSKAEELALESEALAEDRLEREGYEWSVDADVQLRRCAAELRRLAALERAIMDAEPVAWANPYGGFLSATHMEQFATGLEKQTHTIPLYTLNGIKP